MSKIASKIQIRVKILKIALVYSFLMIIFFLQFYKRISETKNNLKNLNKQISIMTIENLSNSIWGFDNISYRKMIEGILKLDEIGSILFEHSSENELVHLSNKNIEFKHSL